MKKLELQPIDGGLVVGFAHPSLENDLREMGLDTVLLDEDALKDMGFADPTLMHIERYD